MIHLVTGGSGSGKSEYAENWLTGRNKKDGTYIYCNHAAIHRRNDEKD